MIDISRIMELIPHRYPFLLVDRVVEIQQGSSITAIKNVTINEPFFAGHFPGNPIMPGVLIIEALAQASGILVANFLCNNSAGKEVILMSIDNAKFRKIVQPGDTIKLICNITQNRANVWKFASIAQVDGLVAAECNIMAMIRDKE
ncbi:MAG: 3-hydroxyacyl-ACP dehydratase FabZ [Rickettsiaceae bacterium]|nr:3-hydroxyacyl-ACP dehydratase FabZ [Rickettsiaceae bacterium]